MRRLIVSLASNLLVASLIASGGPSRAEEIRSSPSSRFNLEYLKDVGLGDDQTKKIAGLTDRFEQELAQAEKDASPTTSQRSVREEAIRHASEAVKKPEARQAVARAFLPTGEQRRAARRMQALEEEFERAVFAVLTEDQKRRLIVSDRRLELNSGYIVIRLNLDLPADLDGSSNLLEVVKTRHLDALNALSDTLQAAGLTDVRRLVRRIPETHEDDPETRNELDRLKRRLRSYWRIDARPTRLNVHEVLGRLRKIPVVESAYLEPTLGDPSVVPVANPYGALQGYLDPAPSGVDARYALTKPYGSGQGVGLVDIERGWNLEHEDLVDQGIRIIFGDAILGDHGTGVLGSIVAADNAIGIVGVAPLPGYVLVSSYLCSGTTATYLAEAILASADLMDRGDVLLLEVGLEGGGKPVELIDDYRDAIRFAILQGIIVVEAAGDGSHDLDAVTDVSGRHILDRSSVDYRDSGAIFVGGSDPRDAHNRCLYSCFGSRLDCFAWGRFVVTCGPQDLDDGGGDHNKTYRKSFGGTSSAAAIVAGVAVVVQARIKGSTGNPATPSRIRSLLSDPATGTPQGSRVSGRIGVMPDLRAIFDSIEKSCTGPTNSPCPSSP